MDWDEFREWSHRAADWGADYRSSLRDRPVRANTAPGDIAAQIAAVAARGGRADGGDLRRLRKDHRARHDALAASALLRLFRRPMPRPSRSLPNIWSRRWRRSACSGRPRRRPPSSRPKMIDWLRQALGLPEGFSGVIQDSASSATLAAVLTMRERALDWAGNTTGPCRAEGRCASTARPRCTRRSTAPSGWPASARTIWSNCRQGAGCAASTRPSSMRRSSGDKAAGLLPAGIIASVGGTSIGGTTMSPRCAPSPNGTGSISMSMRRGQARR